MWMFLSTAVLCIFVWKIFFPVPEPIAGIYSQPGKRGIFKQIFMFILLQLRKYKSDANSNEVGLGINSKKNINDLESVKVRILSQYMLEISEDNAMFRNLGPVLLLLMLFYSQVMLQL